MNIIKTTLVAGAFAVFAQVASAASILVDDFSVFQQVIDVPNTVGDVNTSSVGGIGDLAATRTMTVATNNAGLNASTFTSTGASGFLPANSLTLINGTGQSSVASVTYAFAGPTDLTLGGLLDKFFFEFPGGILGGDVIGTTFTTDVVSTGGNGQVVENLTPATSPFLSFSELGFGAVDFGNVTSLMFTFQSVPSFDGSLLSISVVPLPASGLLLLGGLGGLAAFGRRRRRKAA